MTLVTAETKQAEQANSFARVVLNKTGGVHIPTREHIIQLSYTPSDKADLGSYWCFCFLFLVCLFVCLFYKDSVKV